MRYFKSLSAFLTIFIALNSTAQIKFDDYFYNKTLRFDYYHTGDINSQQIAFDELLEEPYYSGSRVNLIDNFRYGNYMVEVYDIKTGTMIFSKGYSTLFSEWLTTAEAKIIKKAFSETVTFPFPKEKVLVKFLTRNKRNEWDHTFSMEVDPASYFIKKSRRFVFDTYKPLDNGDCNNKVDIVIIPDGYSVNQFDKIKKDADIFIKNMFGTSPYKENKDKFNVWVILAPSPDSGITVPKDGKYCNTVIGTSFYTFDLERYCMVEDNKKLRDVASNAPYDQIYVLANTSKYGGGAIYNHYSVTVTDNKAIEYITVHEFGHGFGGLGDEYYSSSVAYEEFYKLDLEPWEPNLTTLVNFDAKWKSMMDKSTPVPTPATNENAKLLGVYEGGGYVSKGVYRPMQDCTMKSLSVDNFCPVCKKALTDMIKFYSE